MVSMNKPAQNSTNWYTAVTDNWTAIENGLIDRSLVPTKGDLLVATAASTPARQAVGSDGQILSADSAQSSGVRWISGTGVPNASFMNDLIYDKRFFSNAGLLPGSQHYETAAGAAPAVDWDNTGVTSTAVGTFRRWQSIASTQLVGWDLGANRQRVLLLVSSFLDCSGIRDFFMTTTKPTSGDCTGNGYAGGINNAGSGRVLKITSGSFADLFATNYLSYVSFSFGQAMLFDNGNIRYFYRFGNFQWIEGTYKNDGTFTTVRYPGIRLYGGGGLCLGPVSIHYDT